MLTTPKISETRTKATSTSHQTSTLPETHFAEIGARTSTETRQEDTDTMLTYDTKTSYYNVLIQHYTVLYPITNVLKVVRHALCISYDLKWVREGCTIPFPIIVPKIHVTISPQFLAYNF